MGRPSLEEPRSAYVTVRLTEKEFEDFKTVVTDQGTTVSDVLRQGIRETIAFAS